LNPLKIDPEFKNLLPPLTEKEFSDLENLILEEGCRDALVIWNGILVDGHNRYEICQKHGLNFEVQEKEFIDHDEVVLWMIRTQLGRRSIAETDIRMGYLRGLRYVLEKKKAGGQPDNQNAKNEVEKTPTSFSRTAERLAEQYKINEKTVREDGKFAKAVDTIGEAAGEEVKRKILNKEIHTTKQDILHIVKDTPKEELKEVFADVTKPIKAKKKEDKPAKVAPGKPETEGKEETPTIVPGKPKGVKEKSPVESKPGTSRKSNNKIIARFPFIVQDFIIAMNPYVYDKDSFKDVSDYNKECYLARIDQIKETLDTVEKNIKGDIA
jgi:hypothetical protein